MDKANRKHNEEVHLPAMDVDMVQHTIIKEEEMKVMEEEIIGEEEVVVAPAVKLLQEVITGG